MPVPVLLTAQVFTKMLCFGEASILSGKNCTPERAAGELLWWERLNLLINEHVKVHDRT